MRRDGRRKQFASWTGKITSSAWHELGAQVRGERIQIFWNGAKIIDARDATFADAGKVGVWTKADSVTHFDDLSVTADRPRGSSEPASRNKYPLHGGRISYAAVRLASVSRYVST